MVQTFIANALAELDLENCQAAWDTLDVLVKDFFNAPLADKVDIGHHMALTIQDGVAEWKKVRTVLGYVEQKRKLVDSEAKRLNEMESTLNVKQANALIAFLVATVREEVEDADIRSRISTKLIRALNQAA